ncbi:MAG: TadE family protein [Pedococcus sp.]
MEFAIVLPVLLSIVFSIIGFGIVFAQQLALGNAARQIARSAAVDGSFCGTGGGVGGAGTMLTGQAKVNATTLSVVPNNVGVAIKRSASSPSDYTSGLCSGDTAKACLTSAPGDNVYARLTYTSTLGLPFFRPSFDLSAVGAFRCEFS